MRTAKNKTSIYGPIANCQLPIIAPNTDCLAAGFTTTPKFFNVSSRGERGFTLVETVVALGLFVTVIMIGIGSLASMVAATQETKATVIIIDNLNFALDGMVRSIRTGVNYHCGAGDLTLPLYFVRGDSELAFLDSLGRTIAYRLRNGAIERSTDGGFIFLGVTSPQITIEALQFFVEGSTKSDLRQPRALIIIRGTAGTADEVQTFDIQTLVTQRIFDI